MSFSKDLKSYTETDVGGDRLSVSDLGYRVTMTAVDRAEDVRLSKNYGANFFTTLDVAFKFQVTSDASGGPLFVMSAQDADEHWFHNDVTRGCTVQLYQAGVNCTVAVREKTGAGLSWNNGNSVVIPALVWYWCDYTIGSGVGATSSCDVYSDEDKTVLEGTSTLTMTYALDSDWFLPVVMPVYTTGIEFNGIFEDVEITTPSHDVLDLNPYQDISTYEKNDSDNVLSLEYDQCRRQDVSGLDKGYAYKDYGVDYFDGDFIHWFEWEVVGTAASAVFDPWMLANLLNYEQPLRSTATDYIVLMWQLNIVYLAEKITTGSIAFANQGSVPPGIYRYGEIERDESFGSYGTLYYRDYADKERTNLNFSLAQGLRKKADYRYYYVNNGYYATPQVVHNVTDAVSKRHLIDTTKEPKPIYAIDSNHDYHEQRGQFWTTREGVDLNLLPTDGHYVGIDYGADNIDEFTITGKINISNDAYNDSVSNSELVFAAVAQGIGKRDTTEWLNYIEATWHSEYTGTRGIYARLYDGIEHEGNVIACALDTDYWFTLEHVNGNVELTIYSDLEMTVEVGVSSTSGTANTYRYLYPYGDSQSGATNSSGRYQEYQYEDTADIGPSETLLDYERGFYRGINRGINRGI